MNIFHTKSRHTPNSHTYLDISEEPTWALMGCVYDLTLLKRKKKKGKNISSPRYGPGPLFVHVWQSFLFAERCFQPLHHNLPVMKETLPWKYSVSQRKCCCCHAHGDLDFLLIAHLSQEQIVACHFGYLKLFAFFWQGYFLCNISTALILLHDSCG